MQIMIIITVCDLSILMTHMHASDDMKNNEDLPTNQRILVEGHFSGNQGFILHS